MKQFRNEEQSTFPAEDCGCEACIGERQAIKEDCTCWCHNPVARTNGSGIIMCQHCHPNLPSNT